MKDREQIKRQNDQRMTSIDLASSSNSSSQSSLTSFKHNSGPVDEQRNARMRLNDNLIIANKLDKLNLENEGVCHVNHGSSTHGSLPSSPPPLPPMPSNIARYRHQAQQKYHDCDNRDLSAVQSADLADDNIKPKLIKNIPNKTSFHHHDTSCNMSSSSRGGGDEGDDRLEEVDECEGGNDADSLSLDQTVLSGVNCSGGVIGGIDESVNEEQCKFDPNNSSILVKRIDDSTRAIRKNKFIKQLSDRLYEQQLQHSDSSSSHHNHQHQHHQQTSQSFDLNNKTVKEKRERFYLNKYSMSIDAQQVKNIHEFSLIKIKA